jgi:hypothetical protein
VGESQIALTKIAFADSFVICMLMLFPICFFFSFAFFRFDASD